MKHFRAKQLSKRIDTKWLLPLPPFVVESSRKRVSKSAFSGQGIPGGAGGGRSDEETEALRKAHEEEIRAMEAAIADMQKSWEEKLAEAQARVTRVEAGNTVKRPISRTSKSCWARIQCCKSRAEANLFSKGDQAAV